VDYTILINNFKNQSLSKISKIQIKRFLTDIRLITNQILYLFEIFCPNFGVRVHLSTSSGAGKIKYKKISQ